MLTNIQRIKLLSLACDSQLKIERHEEGVLVSGFFPEWQEYADLSQRPTGGELAKILKMSPITSNVTRAALRFGDGAEFWTIDDDGHLIFDNKGAAWYLFLSPGANEEEIGQAAVEARAKVIQAIMNAENSNDIPNVRS